MPVALLSRKGRQKSGRAVVDLHVMKGRRRLCTGTCCAIWQPCIPAGFVACVGTQQCIGHGSFLARGRHYCVPAACLGARCLLLDAAARQLVGRTVCWQTCCAEPAAVYSTGTIFALMLESIA
jgi:hypothetical protein